MVVLTPIRRPALSNNGPPEFPGLIAASVWMTPWMSRPPTEVMVRPRALITPVVNVWSSPKGFPMAKTLWPTRRSLEVPTGMGTSFSAGAEMRNTAKSLSGSTQA